MKNIVLFGASGHTGKYILKELQTLEDAHITAFVRTPEKLNDMSIENVSVIQGDALNKEDVFHAMENQDVLVCSLEGDVLTMAKNIVEVLEKTSVERIIWITGMGIHGEITGMRGKMLAMIAKSRPEYIKAADMIANSSAITTLLRCPGIKNGENRNYYLTPEGVQPRHKNIDRAGIAKCIVDIIVKDSDESESLAITN